MYKKIYDKNNGSIMKIDDLNTLKELMVCVIPNSKIKWVNEKRMYKCIARSDNFIILNKPFNLRKDFDGSPIVQYSIFDLTQMKCNRDNLVFGIYDYGKKEDCEEALKRLETALIPWQKRFRKKLLSNVLVPRYAGADETLEISHRGIANIENVVEEIWIEVQRTYKC